jgi:hypothetical protein
LNLKPWGLVYVVVRFNGYKNMMFSKDDENSTFLWFSCACHENISGRAVRAPQILTSVLLERESFSLFFCFVREKSHYYTLNKRLDEKPHLSERNEE